MKYLLAFLISYTLSAATLEMKELADATEFESAIQAEIPVIVQFAASWCQPCHVLQANFQAVDGEYDDADMLLYIVDADVNRSLKKYLGGGYPTVRAFYKGSELPGFDFVGSQSQTYLRGYLDLFKPAE